MSLYDPSNGTWYNYNDMGDQGVSNPLTPTTAPPGQPSSLPLVDPAGGDPSTVAAQVMAAQFANWQSQFQPIEQEAMQGLSFNNPDILPDAVSKATAAATGAYGAMGQTLDIENQEQGIKPTSEQATSTKRMLNIGQASAVAGAANTARQNVRTADELILLGSTPNPNIATASTGT